MTTVPKKVRRQMEPSYSPNRLASKAAAGVTEEEVEKWRTFLDVELTSVAEFMRLFKIPTDRTDTEDDGYTFFDLYEFQFGLLEETYDFWNEDHRADFRIPKSRRRGVSTFFLGFFFERIVRVPGWRGAVIAQTDPDATKHLEFLDQLQAQLPWPILKRLGVKKIKGSAREISIRHGRFKTSGVVVKTGSARGLGRGGQLNGVLQTERPHWAPRAKRDRSSFLRACRDMRGNIVIDESTACGYDEFYDDCMASEKGENPASLVFLPSHHHDLNRRRVRTARDRERLMRTMGEEKRYGMGEESYVFERTRAWRVDECGWSEEDAREDALEFVFWRRYQIDGDCGHLSVFHREEPTTLEEAFSGAGRRVFPVEIMESWKASARRRTALGSVGTLVQVDRNGGRDMQFVANRDGLLTVFEPPAAGGVYTFGSDVASGFETHKDGATEADFNVMNVKCVYTGRTVAQVRGHIFPKPFAKLLLEVCVFYGGPDTPARGFLEINLETVAALLLENEDLEVCGVRGEDVLLTSERKMKVRGRVETVPVFGFKTTTKTKEYLISGYERFMVGWGEVVSGSGNECPVDWLTLGELLRFVRVPSVGGLMGQVGSQVRTKARAESGHDDATMSEMLAIAGRDELLSTGECDLQSSLPDVEVDPVLAYMRERRRRETEPVEPQYAPHPHGGPPIVVNMGDETRGEQPGMWGF